MCRSLGENELPKRCDPNRPDSADDGTIGYSLIVNHQKPSVGPTEGAFVSGADHVLAQATEFELSHQLGGAAGHCYHSSLQTMAMVTGCSRFDIDVNCSALGRGVIHAAGCDNQRDRVGQIHR